MEKLLGRILAAHGGLLRWEAFTKVQASIVSAGQLWDLKGVPQDPTPREMTVYLHQEKASVHPYGGPDKQSSFAPGRVAVETLDGQVLSERLGTPETIHEHMQAEKWDPLDRAAFNGYALWTYLTTPFFMAMPGFGITAIAPWQEGDEVWQGLRVSFPPEIASHSTLQDFYFGEDYLVRRHDYLIDVAGTFDATQYLYDIVSVDGLLLPTKRRAYKKGTDGRPIIESLMVSIDLTNIRFS